MPKKRSGKRKGKKKSKSAEAASSTLALRGAGKAPSELESFWKSALSGEQGRARVDSFLRAMSAQQRSGASRVGVTLERVRASIDGLCEPFEHEAVEAELERLLALQPVGRGGAEVAHPEEVLTVRSAGKRKKKKKKGTAPQGGASAAPRFMTIGSVAFALGQRSGGGGAVGSSVVDGHLHPAIALRPEQLEQLVETSLQDPAAALDASGGSSAAVPPVSGTGSDGARSAGAARGGAGADDDMWNNLENGTSAAFHAPSPPNIDVEMREASGWRTLSDGRSEESEPLLGGRHGEMNALDRAEAATASAAVARRRELAVLSDVIRGQRERTERQQARLSEEARHERSPSAPIDDVVVANEHRQFRQHLLRQAHHIDAWFVELCRFMQELIELEAHMAFCCPDPAALRASITRQALEKHYEKTTVAVNGLYRERDMQERKIAFTASAAPRRGAAGGEGGAMLKQTLALAVQSKTRRLFHETNGKLIASLAALHDQVENMHVFIAPHLHAAVAEARSFDEHLARVVVDKRVASIEAQWSPMQDIKTWTTSKLNHAMQLLKQQQSKQPQQHEHFNLQPLVEKGDEWKKVIFAAKEAVQQWSDAAAPRGSGSGRSARSTALEANEKYERQCLRTWRILGEKEGELSYELAMRLKKLQADESHAQSDRMARLEASGGSLGEAAYLERRLAQQCSDIEVSEVPCARAPARDGSLPFALPLFPHPSSRSRARAAT